MIYRRQYRFYQYFKNELSQGFEICYRLNLQIRVTSSSEKNLCRRTHSSWASKVITNLLYSRRLVMVFTRSSHYPVSCATCI